LTFGLSVLTTNTRFEISEAIQARAGWPMLVS
jgi:hypothetical protein